MVEKVYRRLPLRDLLTDAEKRARDLIEQLGSTLLARASDLRDLSRPIRRKSHYPTLVALQNSLQKYIQSNGETEGMIEYLDRQLGEIREHARRERFTRG
jgi:hypothetical protein